MRLEFSQMTVVCVSQFYWDGGKKICGRVGWGKIIRGRKKMSDKEIAGNLEVSHTES
jgi:hypothetical protein